MVNLNVTLLGSFVHIHGSCSIVCLRFKVVQIKQVDSEMSTKNVSNYK